jgi:hypothetical protein
VIQSRTLSRTKCQGSYGRLLYLIPLAIILVLVATGCSNTQTFASQCAYVIHNGYFDARHVERIMHPGERKNTQNTTVRYVYCNARNYLVSSNKDANVDQHTAIQARTGPDSTGDGTPVNVEVGMHWTLNQNKPEMLRFLGFCEKYNCFAPKDTSENEGSRSASSGWINMTQENHRFALGRAVQNAVLKFKPDVWNDQSKWPQVAKAISADLKPELRAQTSSDDIDYFCGTDVHLKPGANANQADAWTCPDIAVTVERVEPQDSGIKAIYNQQVQQQQEAKLAMAQKKTNAAILEAARVKYGPHAQDTLGLIDACKAGGCPGRYPR